MCTHLWCQASKWQIPTAINLKNFSYEESDKENFLLIFTLSFEFLQWIFLKIFVHAFSYMIGPCIPYSACWHSFHKKSCISSTSALFTLVLASLVRTNYSFHNKAYASITLSIVLFSILFGSLSIFPKTAKYTVLHKKCIANFCQSSS